MVSFVQANFVIFLGAIVGGTVVWAVVSSLVPSRKQKITVARRLPEAENAAAGRAVAARG